MKYTKHLDPAQAPQTEKAKKGQKRNSAGGYSFKLDKFGRLERFLILGCEGGTYYSTEKKLTKENAKCVEKCLAEDPARAVKTIVDVSEAGRAPKNDPAILALAIVASSENEEARKLALQNLNAVCRIGTHLFQFVDTVDKFRGWGRGLRSAVGRWYTSKSSDQLAYQLLKYQNREGWAHKDVLKLAHTDPPAELESALRWAVYGPDDLGPKTIKGKGAVKDRSYGSVGTLPALLTGYEILKRATTTAEVVSLIETYGFTHEMIPNEWKGEKEVWEALLQKMPYTAMIRNLAKMTSIGLIAPLSKSTGLVSERLADSEMIRKARVHPIAILNAMKTYGRGHGLKGSLAWHPDQRVMDALNAAFYGSFSTIEPTGKNYLLGIDVSGSMTGGSVGGSPTLTPREAAAAMAMVVARTEKNWHCMGFFNRFIELKISPNMRLDEVCRVMNGLPFNSTDCSLPMTYATYNNMEVDAFAVFTDNETYAGRVHPHIALEEYRQKSGRPAVSGVFGLTSTNFTIADPDDAGQMDFVGLDSAAPSVFADFVRG